MELPPKPELERRVRMEGEVTVIELTPESEQIWSDYLRKLHFAKIALRSLNETTETTNAEGAAS